MMRREKKFGRRELSGASFPEDLHPVLARLYRARRIDAPEQMDYALTGLHTPATLKNIEHAVALLADIVQRQKRALVVADFDVDGATSCAVAVRALRALGAAHVDFLIPNRFKHGYGLTPEIVALAREKNPDLIITVDNGISSIEGVEAARAAGIETLITDHHLPGPRLPAAGAIVNPNQPEDGFPSKNLAGVGVIYYVMLALRTRLRELGWFKERAEPNLASLLDLVALGTVSDMVPLDRNNRILVAQGVARINRGLACAGIQAIIKVADWDAAALNAERLAYHVAPRLNAAGRLDDMSLGVAALLCDAPDEAFRIAKKLDKLNRERQTLQRSMHAQALQYLPPIDADGNLPKGICLYNKDWHQGITGLVASYVKEKTYRPVIAFAPFGDTEIKGSARSIDGLHIRDTLEAIAHRQPSLLQKFGGHAMAAGLTLKTEDYETFSAMFREEAQKRLRDDALRETILTDGELEPREIDLGLAELLSRAGPWGQGFPPPLFDGIFNIVAHDIVGGKHLKLSLRPRGYHKVFDAIAFNYGATFDIEPGREIRAAYRLDAKKYRSRQTLQLLLEYLEETENETAARHGD